LNLTHISILFIKGELLKTQLIWFDQFQLQSKPPNVMSFEIKNEI